MFAPSEGIQAAALAVLFAAAIYLVLLGITGLTAPRRLFRFLSSFAQTTRANLIEMSGRFLVGIACILLAPSLPSPRLFFALGSVLACSAVILALLPDAHRRFANRVVPKMERALPLISLVSLLMGLGLLGVLLSSLGGQAPPY